MRVRSFFAVVSLMLGTSCVPPFAMRDDAAVTAQKQTAAAAPATQPKPGIAPGILLHSAGLFGAPAGAQTGAPLLPQGAALLQPAILTTPSAPPFAALGQSADSNQRAIDCLTAAIYYEARSESIDGQRAVAQVVLNRVRSPAFPASVCGVVYEGSKRSTGCQFSFTCDGSMLAGVRNPAAWERAREIATAALGGYVFEPVGTATFYHANYVSPWWAPSLTQVTQIGAHIFYRWPGSWGQPGAFRQTYSGLEPQSGGGASADTSMEAVMQVAVEGGIITIHRGTEAPTAATSVQTVAGVRVHMGATMASNDRASGTGGASGIATGNAAGDGDAGISADAGAVTVHRGTLPGAKTAATVTPTAPTA